MAQLQDRMNREAQIHGSLMSLANRQRAEIEAALGNPPNYGNVPESLWLKIQKEQQDEIAAFLLLLFIDSAAQHGLPDSDANLLAADFSRLAGQQAADIVANTRSAMQAAPRGEVLTTLSRLFGDERFQRIAVTDVTLAQHAGSEAAAKRLVYLSPEDIWHTEEDGRVCPVCAPLNGKPRSVWSRYFPDGPPSPHPFCRCWIEYVNQSVAP